MGAVISRLFCEGEVISFGAPSHVDVFQTLSHVLCFRQLAMLVCFRQ